MFIVYRFLLLLVIEIIVEFIEGRISWFMDLGIYWKYIFFFYVEGVEGGDSKVVCYIEIVILIERCLK